MNKYIISKKTDLLRKTKEIYVPCHGAVSITLMAKCFIDTRYFQRLYSLKQLGSCRLIFPGAEHTRGEHSIGTYYLADRVVSQIKATTDECKMIEWLNKCPELKSHFKMKEFAPGFDCWIMELIKISALCHDIGHGPYSHMFDDMFIKHSIYKNHPMATHEARSCAIVELIVNESEILSKYITVDDIKFMQSIIDPDPDREGFIYQIVSNNLNGLDVDKYDYIKRDTLHTGIQNGFDHARLIDSVLVIDNKISYSEQAEYDIYNMFATRHRLHRTLYGHKGVISAQYIINGIMNIIDKVIDIASSITDFNKFVIMTDDYITQYMNIMLDMKNMSPNPFQDKITEADYVELEQLQKRLQTHSLYPHIGTILSCEPKIIGVAEAAEAVDTTDIKDEFSDNFNDDEHFIYCSKVGFVSGNKLNPLDSIYVYKTKDLFLNGANVVAHKIKKNDISFIIPDVYQEYVTMIFRKDNDLTKASIDKEKFRAVMQSDRNKAPAIS